MPSRARILLVVLLLALLPLRAVASVTIGFCASNGGPEAIASHQGHDASANHEGHDDSSSEGRTATCSYCAEHCAGLGFVTPAADAGLGTPAGAGPIPFGKRTGPGFVPEQVERPPLYS